MSDGAERTLPSQVVPDLEHPVTRIVDLSFIHLLNQVSGKSYLHIVCAFTGMQTGFQHLSGSVFLEKGGLADPMDFPSYQIELPNPILFSVTLHVMC